MIWAEGVGQSIWHLSGMCEALGVISITVPKFFYVFFPNLYYVKNCKFNSPYHRTTGITLFVPIFPLISFSLYY